MDESTIACAANHIAPCLRRDDHLPTCPGDCTGCAPRPAVHGYLCRRHYEQVERAWNTHARLHSLLGILHGGEKTAPEPVIRTINGVKHTRRLRITLDETLSSRAVQTPPSASTVAGPRVPLSALHLDLDELDRTDPGDVTTEQGALIALDWARAVFAIAARHPTEPKAEKLRRTRCPSCRRVTCIVEPPGYVGDRHPIRCVSCSFVSSDPDFVEAAAHLEIRVDARTRRWVDLQAAIAGDHIEGEDRAGLARLADALR